MGNVLILNYHEILPDSSLQTKAHQHAVKKQDFIDQLTLIERKNIPIVSMKTWLEGQVEADFAVILTFDGGFASDFNIVKPILEERQIKASFFPVLDLVNQENRLNWEQITTLSNSGFEIGSHSVSGQNMRRMRKEPCKLELELSKRLLEQKIGEKVWSFAAPYGSYNRRLLKLAFYAGYKNIFTTRAKINESPDDFIIHRWNLKLNTPLASLDKILNRAVAMPDRPKFFTKLKSHFSLSFGIGLIKKANLELLKMNEK